MTDEHAAEATPTSQTPPSSPSTSGLPEDVIPVIPVRNLVQFPGVVLPVTVGRARSVAAAQEAARTERPVGILLQRDEAVEDPTGADMHRVGTTASILRYVTTPDGSHHLVCQGQQRFRIVEWVPGHPFMAARVEMIEESDTATPEVMARFLNLRNEAVEALQLLPQAPQELLAAVQAIESPGELADMTASYMDLKPAEKQEVLETVDLPERLDKVGGLLARRIEVLRLSRDLRERTREAMDERQREYLLREQLRAIQKELGEADEGRQAEIGELQDAIAKAGMPADVREHAEKELRRLERMPEAAAEYSMVRSYLDWLIEMPWDRRSESRIDIAEARRILDEDHYGLEKVKRRILEFLAVRKLNPEGRSPILCFVGPPGVGKTSLGQSIARATGRAFARVSLGGVHDESEIRGHRRTYVGALPGNIVQAIRKAGTRDCVLMLDEMDKLGQGFHGDPSAALLEVLDPEQNATFRDHYLGVPFDLSKVMFIATANMLDTIPGPLRDRMEVIELSGYTEDEKLEIAKRYLLARQLAANGLTREQLEIPDDTLRAIIRDHTREAGNRHLERLIGAVGRYAAVRIAEGAVERMRVEPEDLTAILGPPRFENDVAMRTSVPGVATGLAWTPVGGDILFIEASRFSGSGRLILTGQLGEVMKESAQAALSLVKSRVKDLGLDPEGLDRFDIHIHVPAGAIPKDGPSAGVAIFTALVSLLSGRCIRSDTAMTGEISLRGLVLPVGGIREKVVAAQRAGLKTVMLPARNRKDFDDIPAAVRERLNFVWLERVDDAVRAALASEPSAEAAERKAG
ncbi:endopeptidase La [Azospirillum tabaci]|uniref:endopeptidase La n=1 Tax=Azospirillum tabaci TaxID=2752310 RepID=UPI001FE3748B|nr:endopeptidase La [Azospirillum tabaci]